MDFFGQPLLSFYFQINHATIVHCINHHYLKWFLISHLFPGLFPQIINVLSLRSKSTVLCLASWFRSRAKKTFVSGRNVRLCQEGAQKGHCQRKGLLFLVPVCGFGSGSPLTRAACGWAPRGAHAPASFASAPAESHEHLGEWLPSEFHQNLKGLNLS